MSNTGNPPPGGTPPPSQAPDSKPPDSGGCAEIPTASHAVLTAAINLVVQIPLSPSDAAQNSSALTLSNDDGSYSKTLTFATDATTGYQDGTSMLTFEGLTDGHTYTLQGQDDAGSYTIFSNLPYHDVVNRIGTNGASASGGSSTSSAASDASPAPADPGVAGSTPTSS